MKLDRNLAHTPALTAPVDTATLRLIEDAEQHAVENYPRIVKALVTKAKEGNLTAIELVQKEIVRPIKEAQAAHVASQATPQPLTLRVALFNMSRNVLDNKNATLTVTPEEYKLLPADIPHENVVINDPSAVSSDGTSPVPTDGTVAHPQVTVPSGPPANKECQECHEKFYSAQPAAKWCRKCREVRSLRALAESRKARGKVLTPKMRELVEPDPNGSGSLGELTR